MLYDSAGNVLYIGQAKSFRAEVWQTLKEREIPVGMRFGPRMMRVRPTIWELRYICRCTKSATYGFVTISKRC